MGWLREKGKSERLPAFNQCPGCRYDFLTGDGTRSCNWGDCPYLPEAYKVFCPACNYNFASGEGAPWCDDPVGCEWASEGRRHAALALKFFGASRPREESS